MSTIKVQNIQHTGSSTNAISLASDGTCIANITNKPNRNLIINGAMQVAQRGTSTTTSGGYPVDRFPCFHGGTDEAPTFEQADVASGTTPYTLGFRKSLKITNGNQTSVGTTDYIWIQNKYEAQDIANTGWNYLSSSSYITLSFWVKSSIAQDFKGYIETFDGTKYNYPFATGSLTADTWTKVTKTISGNSNLQFDNNNAIGLNINILPFLGTDYTSNSATENAWQAYSGSATSKDSTSTWYDADNATFEITGVQLEVSDHATSFEHRSFGQELALCQRYYYEHARGSNASPNNRAPICSGTFYNSTEFFGVIQFPVTMRSLPTLVKTSGSDYYKVYGGGTSDTCNDVRLQNSSLQGYSINVYDGLSGTQGHGSWCETNNGAAIVAFSSEL